MATKEITPEVTTLPGTGDYDKVVPGEFDEELFDRTQFEEDFRRIFGEEDVYRLGE